MAEDVGVQRVREYLASFAPGDFSSLPGFFHEDIVWRVAGDHRLSGTYRGRDELFAYFAEVSKLTGGTLKLTPESILGSDQHTAVFARVTADRDGKHLDVLMAEMFERGPDGRWTEFWALADDQDAVDEFWR